MCLAKANASSTAWPRLCAPAVHVNSPSATGPRPRPPPLAVSAATARADQLFARLPLLVFSPPGGSAALHTESRWVIYLFIISYTRGYLFIFCRGCFPKKRGTSVEVRAAALLLTCSFLGPVGSSRTHNEKKTSGFRLSGRALVHNCWRRHFFFQCPVHLARGIIRACRRGGSQQQQRQQK